MRKILYAIAFLFLVVSYSYSQGRTQDVVYLKNGSVIRGLIIEQVPNKSIKVQTRDESIFVYQMDEIEKLGKEEDTSYSFKKILGPKRTYDIKGYRGFLDLGYTWWMTNERLMSEVTYAEGDIHIIVHECMEDYVDNVKFGEEFYKNKEI